VAQGRGTIVTSSAENQTTTEKVVARFLDRLGEQDADGIGELFADQIDWFVPGRCRGQARALGAFKD
jgi:hypothetical protein